MTKTIFRDNHLQWLDNDLSLFDISYCHWYCRTTMLFGNVSGNNWCRLGTSQLWHAACWKHAVMASNTQRVQYPIEQHLVATCGCLLDGSQGFLSDHQQKAAMFNARGPIHIDELILFLSNKWACIKLLYELLKEPLYIYGFCVMVYIYIIYIELCYCVVWKQFYRYASRLFCWCRRYIMWQPQQSLIMWANEMIESATNTILSTILSNAFSYMKIFFNLEKLLKLCCHIDS